MSGRSFAKGSEPSYAVCFKGTVSTRRSLSVELTGDSVVPHLGEFLRPLVSCTELESIDIWANRIESFAGLWGVGLGGIHLPKLHSLSLRGSPCSIHTSRSVFAAKRSLAQARE